MRIPLYNQTGTPSTQTKAQQLSPRASAGAFTSQGQAVAQLGQQIAKTGGDVADKMMQFQQQQEKIEFEFAMAEKNAETERVLDEARVSHNEQAMKFIEENQDTDTATFRQNYDTFNNDFLSANLDTRTDLTDNQKQAVRTGLNAQFIAKGNAGAKNAFDRAQVIRGQSAKEALANMIQDASSYPNTHPERRRLEADIEQRIITAERDGLSTGYSVQSVRVGFETLDFSTRIRGAGSFDALDNIESELSSSALGASGRNTMVNAIKARRSEIRGEIFQSTLTSLNDLEVSFEDRDAIVEAVRSGTIYEGVSAEGDAVSLDTSGLKQSTRDTIAETYVGRKFKDVDDTISQTLVNTIISTANSGAGADEILNSVNAMFTSEEMAKNNKDLDEMNNIVVETASQMSREAARQVSSGEYDPDEVKNLLDASEQLLSGSIAGNIPLVQDVDTSKTAGTISDSIVRTRLDIKKADEQLALITQGVTNFRSGTLNISDIGLTTSEEQTVIASGLQNLDLNSQINLLSDNDVEFKQWSGLLGATLNQLRDPSVTEITPMMQEGLKIFNALSLQGREGVFRNHIKSEDRVFWDSWKTISSIHEPEMALKMIKTQKTDTEVSLSFSTVEETISSQGEEMFRQGWFKSAWAKATGGEQTQMPVNTSQITTAVSKLTKDYIRVGIGAEQALELAANNYFATHQPVGNVMLRIPDKATFPDSLNELREIVVQNFLDANPDLSYEADELSIMNVGGSVDIFNVVHNGGFPVSGTFSSFTLEQGKGLLAQADALKAQRQSEKTKEVRESIIEAIEKNLTPKEKTSRRTGRK